MKTKREHWGKKYFVVIRNSEGKRQAWRRWHPKKFNNETATKIFKENHSLYKEVYVRKLSNVYEHFDYREKSRYSNAFNSRGKRQYMVTGKIAGKSFSVRSSQYPLDLTGEDLTKREMRSEAYGNMQKVLAVKLGMIHKSGDDLTEKDIELLNKKLKVEREGYVYYTTVHGREKERAEYFNET